MTAPYLLHDEATTSMDGYLERGGGAGIARAVEIGPGAVLDELDRSGLRGRGGAGFPTGRKWRTIAEAGGATRYVVCNAAEGEPGTFKDRALLRHDPYQVVEGIAIAAFAVGARETFIGLKASFAPEREAVTRAVVEMERAGFFDELSVGIVAGPEEYLFGEEKAMLEVIEGNDPLPRWLPPYLHGLFATSPQLGWESHAAEQDVGSRSVGGSVGGSNPTLVNNVETLANVTHVLAGGADWFRSLGTPTSTGNVVCTVSGDAERAGVVEVELGTPLAEVLASFGAPRAGRRVKAVLPGVSNAVLAGARVDDVSVSYESFAAAGSGLGSAGFVVYDDTACMTQLACLVSRFLWVESCGQCPPCKLGTGAIAAALDAFASGTIDEDDSARLEHWLANVADANRCSLPVEAQQLVPSLLAEFADDFTAHADGTCRLRHDLVLPKLVDIADGVAVFDDRQATKQPDWTYASG
jgi:NADH:ubiquinone oxidoreductase subunit F (NADH-binding)